MKNFFIHSVFMILSINVIAQTIPSYLPTNSLVAWYPFNGNCNDESGNGNNATYTGTGVTLSSDRFGSTNKAYDFAGGSNDYVRIPADNFPTNDRTISLWFKVPTVANRPMLFCYGGGGYLGYGTSFLMGLNVMGNATYHSQSHYLSNAIDYPYPSDPVNQWIHWAITISGSHIEMYVNGVITATNNAFQYATIVAGKDLVFGVMPNANGIAPYTDVNGGYLQGKLDDIAVWSRALTSAEITQVYQACLPPISSQPSSVTKNVGSVAQFTIASSDPNATFQWQTFNGSSFQNLANGGQYSGVTNDTMIVSNLTMSNNGQSFRCVVVTGSCSDTSLVKSLTVNTISYLNQYASDLRCTAFPNPVMDVLNVNINTDQLPVGFELINIYGQLEQKGVLKEKESLIDMTTFKPGVYYLTIKDESRLVLKIVKY